VGNTWLERGLHVSARVCVCLVSKRSSRGSQPRPRGLVHLWLERPLTIARTRENGAPARWGCQSRTIGFQLLGYSLFPEILIGMNIFNWEGFTTE
jgi:hypothetical protein